MANVKIPLLQNIDLLCNKGIYCYGILNMPFPIPSIRYTS